MGPGGHGVWKQVGFIYPKKGGVCSTRKKLSLPDTEGGRELWNLQVAQHTVPSELRVYEDLEHAGSITGWQKMGFRFDNNQSPWPFGELWLGFWLI